MKKKTSAILRIVLYSLLILVLLAVFFGLLGLRTYSSVRTVIRSASQEGMAFLENIPVTGELHLEEVLDEALDEVLEDPPVTWPDETIVSGPDGLEVDLTGMEELDIDWAAGAVTITMADVSKLQIRETGEGKKPLSCRIEEDEVKIDFYDPPKRMWGVDQKKNLELVIPTAWARGAVSLEIGAGEISVTDVTLREFDLDSGAGKVDFANCAIEEVDLNTAAGVLHYTGTLLELDCDAATAEITAQLHNIPRSIDMDTMSGSLELTLPQDCGFTLKTDTLSGDLQSEFEMTKADKTYTAGDGACKIKLDGMSTNITLKKAP